MEQFFDSDHRQKTYYGLGYVMPYDQLADLLYSNSMSIGRAKMHNTSPTRKHKKTCKKAVNRKPRPAEEWEET